MSTMESVVAAGAGLFLLGEVLDWPQLFCGALVVAGVILVQRGSPASRQAREAMPVRCRW